MSGPPDGIVLARHRDLRGLRKGIWVRRGSIVLLAVVPGLAAFNVFGQQPTKAVASSPAARLELSSPTALRGGLLVQTKFTVTARRTLRKATLVLDRGWLDNITINTIEPSPIGEGSDDGRLVLQLGHVPAGHSRVLGIQLQVNPTNVGGPRQGVTLLDGSTRLARIDRTVTIFP